MTQYWPAYLSELIGIPVVDNGVGAQSVQEAQVSFDAWVEQHKDDADFARTGHICWCGHPNLNGPNSKDPRVDRHTIVPTNRRWPTPPTEGSCRSA